MTHVKSIVTGYGVCNESEFPIGIVHAGTNKPLELLQGQCLSGGQKVIGQLTNGDNLLLAVTKAAW